jgi:hypothetical protein
MKTNEEIVAVAELVHAVDAAEDDDELAAKLGAELDSLGSTDRVLVHVAQKLLGGRGYGIDTDKPQPALHQRISVK